MLNKVFRIKIYQPQAHYRLPFTYQRRHTYPIVPYSTFKGLLCNILGIRGYTYGENPEDNPDFRKLKQLKISICGQFESKSTEYTWFRNLERESHIKRFGSVQTRSINGTIQHIGGQIPVLIDILNDVRTIVYLYYEDTTKDGEIFIEKIRQNFESPTNRLYPLYLGRAEDWFVIEDIRDDIELTSERLDADFDYFFWIPENIWLPDSDIDFDYNKIDGLCYRLSTFYEYQDGVRNFNYISVKLNDGLVRDVDFLYDAESKIPVFFANLNGGKT